MSRCSRPVKGISVNFEAGGSASVQLSRDTTGAIEGGVGVSVFSELGTPFKSLFRQYQAAAQLISMMRSCASGPGGAAEAPGRHEQSGGAGDRAAPLVMVQIIGGTSGPENVWTGRRVAAWWMGRTPPVFHFSGEVHRR